MSPPKPALRAAMLARLRAVSPDERRARSVRLVARLLDREDWQRARVVGLFAPLRSEPDVDPLWALAGAMTGKTAAYPRVEPGGLVLRVVGHPGELVRGDGRLREPPASAPALARWPDVLLVPGLAFTAAGGRLGRGGGFYDRLLARAGRAGCRCVGVGFGFQVLPELPLEAHDARLDAVVTDDGSGAGSGR